MQPWEAVPAHCLATMRGVLFDVDDTLTRAGKLQTQSLDALWQAHAAGLRLVAATGRPLGFAQVWAATWPVDAVVAENGACWCWQASGGLEVDYLDAAPVRVAQQAQLQAIEAAVAAALPQLRRTDDSWLRRCELAWDIGERGAVPAADVEALMALIHQHGARSLRSSIHLHAVVGQADKAQGLCRAVQQVLASDLAAERQHWVFVGDSGNDAAAFAFFPYAVGVANVRAHAAVLTAWPRYVTAQSHGAGFAAVVQAIVQAQRR